MATIPKDQIGELNINLVQGDDKTLTLTFNTVNLQGDPVPMDLRDYSAIRLDVKSNKDVNERPFFSFTIGNGLEIIGEDYNVLQFTFTTQFLLTAQTVWYYDIKFTALDGIKHLLEGVILIHKTVTK